MQKQMLLFVSNNLICSFYLMYLYLIKVYSFNVIELLTIYTIFNFFIIVYSQELYSHFITNILKQFLICIFSSLIISLIMANFTTILNIFLFILLIQILFLIMVDYIISHKKLSFLILADYDNSIVYAKKIILKYHKFIEKIEINNKINKINEEEFAGFDYIVTDSEIKKMISALYLKKHKFIIIPNLNEILMMNLYLDKIDDLVVYKNRKTSPNLIQIIVKRSFDFLISLILMTILWPLFIVIAILIKLEDGGPVLYYQRRQTINNKSFVLIKFRTMFVGAEKQTGAVFASYNDNRITRVGRVLRMFRLDELPQLINILKGEMSIVGPRPERLFFIKQFLEQEETYHLRFNCLAGVTGLAQINVNYDSSFIEKLKFDLLYIFRYSLFLDLKIIFNTILVLINPVSNKGIIRENEIIALLDKHSLKARLINKKLVLDNIGK